MRSRRVLVFHGSLQEDGGGGDEGGEGGNVLYAEGREKNGIWKRGEGSPPAALSW